MWAVVACFTSLPGCVLYVGLGTAQTGDGSTEPMTTTGQTDAFTSISGGCDDGAEGQFDVLDPLYPDSGPEGCSGDGTLKLKASAQMILPTVLRVYVRKADDTPFTMPAVLTLYVGEGPTCPNPPNVVKTTQAVEVGAVEHIIDLTVNPYDASWSLGQTKVFWVGKDEGGFQSFRATGVVSVKRVCIP